MLSTRISGMLRKLTRAAVKPRKLPMQTPSKSTVETILAGAARVLEQEGLAGFNTNCVAEQAGVSIRSLYQYFPNKEALVASLLHTKHLRSEQRS